ncbi:MAG: iron ABC transporter permease [Microbacterium sp.]
MTATDWVLPRDHRSRRWRRWSGVFVIGLVLLSGAYLLFGAGNIMSPSEFWHALTAPDEVSVLHRVSVDNRLPRLLLCLMAGAGLAAAGALLQALTRNPIASPELTGVTAGAVAGAIAWIAFVPPALVFTSAWARPLAATIGGLAAAAVVYLLTRRSNGMESTRLLLIGVIVAGVLTSATTLGLLFLGPQATNVIAWLSGSVELRTWTDVIIVASYLSIAAVITLFAIGRANAQQLGDDVARSLGQGREFDRVLVLIAAVALTAGVVSVLGGIGFIGLMAPHMVRGFAGSNLRRQIPAAAFAGAAMMMIADMIARNINSRNLFAFLGDDLAARPLPAGVLLTLFGVPYLASLLWRQRS